MTSIRTTCAYCGVGCGIAATVTGPHQVEIRGDLDHPANHGKLCSKGSHLGETVGPQGRLLHPMIAGQRAGWDEALGRVAGAIRDTIAEHGPDSVAFYVSGQLLTEDYYVANKLMKGFIGSGNIDTNSRLCMSSAVAAHVRAFGEDVVPCSYEDLDEADLILLVGSNTAWCHPVIWQRIEAARTARGTKIVVIDPRRTETAELADLHVPVAPDGDVALFTALLAAMRARGAVDDEFIARRVTTPERFWDDLAVDSGIEPEVFAALVALVAAHPRMVTLFSQGANQSVCGTDKGNAIINLHLATGRIGQPGTGPFSITGQPNAMGGREVGGLANMLAVHMGFSPEERDRAGRFWNAPAVACAPGLKAVDMFQAVHDGRIKFLWIMATNPAVSMPDAGFVREALAKCPMVVVSDCIEHTDTAAFAHIKLPALGWGEKDGTVTNSERVVSRQRALFAPAGEARADWAIVAEVGRRLGWAEAFGWASNAEVFAEYCRQTVFENDGARKLDMRDWLDLSAADYQALAPRQWGGRSPFADQRFTTADGKARLVTVAPPAPAAANPAFPLRLNSGRYRDQWHTMTRTGLSTRLSQHRREPLVEIHPDDAAAAGLCEGAFAQVSTATGSAVFRVAFDRGQRRGSLFVPMHWTDQTSSGGRCNRLPDSANDPVSGQPGFKNTAAAITPAPMDWRAFLVAREAPALPADVYWTSITQNGGVLVELAGQGAIDVDALLPPGPRAESFDAARGTRRIVVKDAGGGLCAALYLTRSGRLPSRDWITAQLVTMDSDGDGDGNLALLAGRPAAAGPDRGAIVCVCFDVGENTLCGAISGQSLASVEAVGAATSAGTNCGSCRPAIARLLAMAA